MIEFTNMNLEKTEPDYFYRVTEFVTTFGKDAGKNKPFGYEREFKGNDLSKCKTDAEKYYRERLAGLQNCQYFLPFAAPENFKLGKNAAFSITLSLVEYYNDDKQFEHDLIGGDEDTLTESEEIETAVLKEKRYNN